MAIFGGFHLSQNVWPSKAKTFIEKYKGTACPRSSDPVIYVSYYIKYTTSLLLGHTVVCGWDHYYFFKFLIPR